MTAPAVRHDLRCAVLGPAGPDAPCTCRQAAQVARVSSHRPRSCVFCGGPAAYQVGPDERACRTHLTTVLDAYYDSRWDGFAPATVVPCSRPEGAT